MHILRNTYNVKNSIEIREELTQLNIKQNNNIIAIYNKFNYNKLPKQIITVETSHWIQ